VLLSCWSFFDEFLCSSVCIFVLLLSLQCVYKLRQKLFFHLPLSNGNFHIDLRAKFIFRYSNKNSSIAGTVTTNALDVSYWHHQCNTLQIGASLILNLQLRKAFAAFYYQMEMKDCTIKGMIDTDCTVGCVYNR
jgi:hypothetical protein